MLPTIYTIFQVQKTVSCAPDYMIGNKCSGSVSPVVTLHLTQGQVFTSSWNDHADVSTLHPVTLGAGIEERTAHLQDDTETDLEQQQQ